MNNASKKSTAGKLMFSLRGDFTHCEWRDESLHVCGYHADRCNNSIVGLEPLTVSRPGDDDVRSGAILKLYDEANQVVIREKTEGVVKTLKGMAGNDHIAGGWYLVGEQREWLSSRFEDFFDNRSEPCNILVAGVAGYAHFFSYLKTVFKAAEKKAYPVNLINIDVIDLCDTPLIEIKRLLENPELLLSPFRSRIGDIKMHPSVRNYVFIKKMWKQLKECKISFTCRSLTDFKLKEPVYHMITEHFLTSMMEKNGDIIRKTRETYGRVLLPGGKLLVASGFPNKGYIETFLKIHSDCGFSFDRSKLEKVWDPFGMSRQQIRHIIRKEEDEEMTFILLDNLLAEFTYTLSSPSGCSI